MDANDEYWQKYDWARPFAEQERIVNVTVENDYRQYLPSDPSHPRAYIPAHVRWAKRYQVGFTCPITGWRESDWYRGITSLTGPYRRVGVLSIDHIIPGSAGGLTTDENIRAICSLANSKKAHKQISDEELREKLLASFVKVDIPEDLLIVLEKYGITSYKIG